MQYKVGSNYLQPTFGNSCNTFTSTSYLALKMYRVLVIWITASIAVRNLHNISFTSLNALNNTVTRCESSIGNSYGYMTNVVTYTYHNHLQYHLIAAKTTECKLSFSLTYQPKTVKSTGITISFISLSNPIFNIYVTDSTLHAMSANWMDSNRHRQMSIRQRHRANTPDPYLE